MEGVCVYLAWTVRAKAEWTLSLGRGSCCALMMKERVSDVLVSQPSDALTPAGSSSRSSFGWITKVL